MTYRNLFFFKSLQKENTDIKAWKNLGLNGIWTHDLCDAGAVLYQLIYQANWPEFFQA